ncbi:MAG: RNA-binding protein [Candidatus Taylorbacteria bacterium RIFCSPLOWO2_01_FULL_44_26]|uniref:RNA-binding protein n=2 Tax=Candidatus Tayloriibacteriota TaxID=1817919 RepID=A0A1G2MKS5_9BACT|nr:MAG: RNA-binding protein [Candidatus Taylorbacteria bacterium RIFCSPHIGHO2_02_FULL_44_12]OHA30765.1 MAG: RNA-binding protein [Candidatus Taylorbacteria bacterium RIFCSPLOWO2_01_FULL_44_26]
MSKRLFVGNLAWGTTDASLKKHFEGAGAVDSASVIMDKMSGRSKGFGFVEMSSDSEAESSVSKLNGSDLDGRKIVVSEARPKMDREG